MSEPPSLNAVEEGIVNELEDAIMAVYPEASFEVRVSGDGRIYLSVYTDVVDDFAIQDLVTERTVDALLHDDVKIHVMPRSSALASPEAS